MIQSNAIESLTTSQRCALRAIKIGTSDCFHLSMNDLFDGRLDDNGFEIIHEQSLFYATKQYGSKLQKTSIIIDSEGMKYYYTLERLEENILVYFPRISPFYSMYSKVKPEEEGIKNEYLKFERDFFDTLSVVPLKKRLNQALLESWIYEQI